MSDGVGSDGVGSDGVVVELPSPGEGRVAVEWDAAELGELRPGLTSERGLWRLAGALDWERVDGLRVLSGRLGDGRGLAIAALRPAGAAGHDEDVCAGLIGTDSRFEALREVLFSTEYGPDGLPRRIGLELLTGESELPLRVAGDAREASSGFEDGLSRQRIGLELRLGEARGPALLELLRPG